MFSVGVGPRVALMPLSATPPLSNFGSPAPAESHRVARVRAWWRLAVESWGADLAFGGRGMDSFREGSRGMADIKEPGGSSGKAFNPRRRNFPEMRGSFCGREIWAQRRLTRSEVREAPLLCPAKKSGGISVTFSTSSGSCLSKRLWTAMRPPTPPMTTEQLLTQCREKDRAEICVGHPDPPERVAVVSIQACSRIGRPPPTDRNDPDPEDSAFSRANPRVASSPGAAMIPDVLV